MSALLRFELITLLLTLALSLAVYPQSTPRIEVFTTSDIPIANSGTAHVHSIDGLRNLTRSLSQGLPKQPEQARQVALARMHAGGEQFNANVQRAATALAKAAWYGIDRVPAVVFDGQAVVYGVNDVATARMQYQQWRRRQAGSKQ